MSYARLNLSGRYRTRPARTRAWQCDTSQNRQFNVVQDNIAELVYYIDKTRKSETKRYTYLKNTTNFVN